MIKAKDLTLIYPGDVVGVKEINFELNKGEIVLLVGPSGAGKSSLLKLFLGGVFPTEGELKINGYTITRDHHPRINELRKMISPIFQDFKLLPEKSALENVALGLRVLGYFPGKIYKEGKKALEEVGLSHKIKTPVERLSYGERQRVAVARAIARGSDIILADEPTGNLDEDNSYRIMELLTGLGCEERIVIIATHEEYLLQEILQKKPYRKLEYRKLELESGLLVNEEPKTE